MRLYPSFYAGRRVGTVGACDDGVLVSPSVRALCVRRDRAELRPRRLEGLHIGGREGVPALWGPPGRHGDCAGQVGVRRRGERRPRRAAGPREPAGREAGRDAGDPGRPARGRGAVLLWCLLQARDRPAAAVRVGRPPGPRPRGHSGRDLRAEVPSGLRPLRPDHERLRPGAAPLRSRVPPAARPEPRQGGPVAGLPVPAGGRGEGPGCRLPGAAGAEPDRFQVTATQLEKHRSGCRCPQGGGDAAVARGRCGAAGIDPPARRRGSQS